MIEEHDKTKKENEQLVEEELRRMRVKSCTIKKLRTAGKPLQL